MRLVLWAAGLAGVALLILVGVYIGTRTATSAQSEVLAQVHRAMVPIHPTPGITGGAVAMDDTEIHALLAESDPVQMHATVSPPVQAQIQANAGTDDAALLARLDELLAELQDPLNPTRATPGAVLLTYPKRAAPWFRRLLTTRSDLSWQARVSLTRAARMVEDPTCGRCADGLSPASERWYRELHDGYVKGHDQDSRWDPLVERAFQLMSMKWTNDPNRHGDEVEVVLRLTSEASIRGCQDPMVSFLRGRSHELMEGDDAPSSQDDMRMAAAVIDASDYNQGLKSIVLMREALFLWWGEDEKVDGPNASALASTMTVWAGYLAKSIAEEDPIDVPYRLQTYADLLHLLHPHDEQAAIDGFLAMLRAEHPRHPVDAIAQAYFMQDWAWEARGSGWASSVTDEGWQLMRSRMSVARDALNRAVVADPDYGPLYETLLDVANGLDAPKDAVWSWFMRLQDLEPGDPNGFESLLDYLEPKWHGSLNEILQVGRAALATGDWADRYPIILQSVHSTLSGYDRDGHAIESPDLSYFHQPEVWADMTAAFGGLLAVYPSDHEARKSYCYYAYIAGRLELARHLFLGMPRPVSWSDQEETGAFLSAALGADGNGSLGN